MFNVSALPPTPPRRFNPACIGSSRVSTAHTPSRSPRNSAANRHCLLRSALFDVPQTRYSFVTTRPFLTSALRLPLRNPRC